MIQFKRYRIYICSYTLYPLCDLGDTRDVVALGPRLQIGDRVLREQLRLME